MVSRPRDPKSGSRVSEGKSIRVVYCEGHRPVRVLLDHELPADGQTVLVVKSGEGAPELLAGERFDVEVQAGAGGPGPTGELHRVDVAGAVDALVFGEPPPDLERRLLELEYGDARRSTRPVDLSEVAASWRPRRGAPPCAGCPAAADVQREASAIRKPCDESE